MRTLRISFTVKEDKAGGLLADLADRVENLDFGVIENVPHTKNAPRKKNGSSVMSTLLSALKSEKTIPDLKIALEKNGFSPGSLNSALHKLMGEKRAKRVGPGMYLTTGKE